MLNNDTSVQECDATKSHSSNAARYKKYIHHYAAAKNITDSNYLGVPPRRGRAIRCKSSPLVPRGCGLSATIPHAKFYLCYFASYQPCASRTFTMAASISFHVFCCVITSFGNMHPSQQICLNALVRLPFSSRSQ